MVSPPEVEHLQGMLSRYVPAAAGALVNSSICIYTRSPDGHFAVGLHPKAPQLVVASPCSGHGFKFASVIGEIVADLALDGRTQHDISRFRSVRFAAGQ